MERLALRRAAARGWVSRGPRGPRREGLPGRGRLSGVGFLRMAMMPMFLPSRLFLLLPPPEVSGSQGNLQVRQEQCLLLQGHDGWPGFRDKTPHGQRRLLEQRHQDEVPAPAENTHQPHAGGPPHPPPRANKGGYFSVTARPGLLPSPPPRPPPPQTPHTAPPP